jgi:hypothetical protein
MAWILGITGTVAFVVLRLIGGQRHLSRAWMLKQFVESAPVHLKHERQAAMERLLDP